MPGIYYSGVRGGAVPTTPIVPLLASRNLTGSTTGVAPIRGGDLVVLTTNSTYSNVTVSSVVVPTARMVLAADITATYRTTISTGPIAGVYGIASSDIATDANGVASISVPASGVAPLAQAIYSLPSVASGIGNEPASGRSYVPVIPFTDDTIFKARLYFASGTRTINTQYDNTLAGFNLSVSNGVQTWTIDPSATTSCVQIIAADAQDPFYNVSLVSTATQPFVFFKILPAYQQALTGVNYTAQ